VLDELPTGIPLKRHLLSVWLEGEHFILNDWLQDRLTGWFPKSSTKIGV